MNDTDVRRRRLCLAARAPGLDAMAFGRLAAVAPDLAPLERPDARAFEAAGLATLTREWLCGATADPGDHLRALDAHGIAIVAADEATYPHLLRLAPGAPAVLFLRGCAAALQEPQVAMVGSRTCTAGGRDTAREFASAFARAGVTVTSGLALGIDAASHAGALAAGGLTIAVLGCGLDTTYPAENAGLAHRVAEHGALVSEFLPGTPPLRAHFPQRNRIIAGLAHGTLVVEAAYESGSLITARLAADAGREVFVIPGSIRNEFARGCHRLLRDGARLVESPEDVLRDLKISLESQLVAAAPPGGQGGPRLDKEYKILLDALAFEPASVDSLIERTGMNSESIASMLLILELDGHVAPHPGGRYSRLAGH